MRARPGLIAVGWTVAEDLLIVVVLVLLPAAGSGGAHAARLLALTLGKVAAFAALMAVVGSRVIPRLLSLVAATRSRELFTLAVVASALGVAYGSARAFGVSLALGAFVAGMVVAQSELGQRAAEESLPLREAFSVLFFVSVGMLFEPRVLVDQPGKLLATLAVVMAGKAAVTFAVARLFRCTTGEALTVAASLAQIGELSFILAGFAVARGLLPREASSLITAGALFSISLNPLLFRALGAWPGLSSPPGAPG